jgi:hypothetical protein
LVLGYGCVDNRSDCVDLLVCQLQLDQLGLVGIARQADVARLTGRGGVNTDAYGLTRQLLHTSRLTSN